MEVFWDSMLCSLVISLGILGGTSCLHLQDTPERVNCMEEMVVLHRERA